MKIVIYFIYFIFKRAASIFVVMIRCLCDAIASTAPHFNFQTTTAAEPSPAIISVM